MASLIKLKKGANTLDLTRHIPLGKYEVNDADNFYEWTDSDYVVHRQITDSKAVGSFTLKFKTVADFEAFINFVESAKDSATGAINAEVYCTNKHIVKNIDCFLNYTPADTLPQMADNKNDGFQVELQERKAHT